MERQLFSYIETRLLKNSFRRFVEFCQPNDFVHGLRHVDVVWGYAKDLLAIYGDKSDLPVVMASTYLHDISVSSEISYSEGERRIKSSEIAGKFLRNIGWGEADVKRVEKAILEHDQAKLFSFTIEGKILKDADFLAGLGAEGIVRIIWHSAREGESFNEVVQRLKIKMPIRMAALFFPESREVARIKWGMVSEFIKDMDGKFLTVKGARRKLLDRDLDRSDLVV